MSIENKHHKDVDDSGTPNDVKKGELDSKENDEKKNDGNKSEHLQDGVNLDNNKNIGNSEGTEQEKKNVKTDDEIKEVGTGSKKNVDIKNGGNKSEHLQDGVNLDNNKNIGNSEGTEQEKKNVKTDDEIKKSKEQNPEQPVKDNPEQPKEQNPEQEKPSLWDRIGGFFGRHKQPESSPKEVTEAPRGKWEGLETAPQPNGNGRTVLPGNNFDKFSDIDKNYSDHPRTDLKETGDDYTATVNPADIEGVYLGDTEVENPDNFWGMHNGSKDAWMDTASHIPEVQERLNAGDSLDSLLDDDRLGPCANAYFNPNNPQAIEVDAMPDGGYMFSDNGRHRIIAAREYGYDIPVRVTGRYD